jgi:NAD(P)H-flavin reductase
MVPVPYRVATARRDTEDTWTLGLEPWDGKAPMTFEPGQFNMLYAFGVGEVPISICGDPASTGPIEHTVRSVGAVTRAICASSPGDSLGVRGPFGSAWPADAVHGRDLVIVAGGIGLAPLRPTVLRAVAERERYSRVVLLYGGRTPDQLLYAGELEAWRDEEVEVHVTVDTATEAWHGNVGVVTTLMNEAALSPERTVAMLCGPEIMMRFAIAALRERGVASGDIHVSLERNMKCAIVSCGHCQFGPTFMCREGPVMRFDRVEPWLAIREL